MMKAVEPVMDSDVGMPADANEHRDQFPLLDMFQDPGSSASQLVLCALRTAALLDRVVARSLSPFNLHHAQFNALVLLKRQRETGLRPSVLGDYLCVSRPNVTKLLARLKSRGLIEERPDPADGRAVLAIITSDGERLADQAFSALTHDLTVAVNTLPADDGLSLRALLDRFRDGLSITLRAAGCGADAQES
jgi:DNA-binding MarR family transcriptional regulator